MAVAPISDDSAQNAPRLALAAGAAVLRADAARVALARLDAALLAVLALEGPTSRQRLLQLLWPDEEPENARNALRQRLFRLRRAVGTELVAGGELLSLAARRRRTTSMQTPTACCSAPTTTPIARPSSSGSTRSAA